MPKPVDSSLAVTRDMTVVHFLLMFGYKLFSAYFPLYLLAKGLSLPQIGYSYLLVYLPIALAAPFVGFAARRNNPALLVFLGVCGYGAYALAMVFVSHAALYYVWQAELGIAAAFFFVSARGLMMRHPLRNVEQGFSWFYNAPVWADAIAPGVGALILWRAGFPAAFSVAFVVTILAALWSLRLWRVESGPPEKISFREWATAWKKLLAGLANRRIAPLLVLTLATLWQAGLYTAFFILFLKNALGWERNPILWFTSLAAVAFTLVYFFFVRPQQKDKPQISIVNGSLIASAASLFFLLPASWLGFAVVFAIDLFQNVGAFVCGAARSTLLAQRIRQLTADSTHEAGALDTIFSPLGIAFGSLTAALLVGYLGYQGLFVLGGAVTLAIAAITVFIAKKGEMG